MNDLLQKAKSGLDKVMDSYPSLSLAPKRLPPQPPPKPAHFSNPQRTPVCTMQQDQPSSIQDPTSLDILRYRYHHGTNLGSIYVLERWLFPSRFPQETKGSSELEAVKAWVEKVGVEAAKKQFEKAWETAISDQDIDWLKNEAKCKRLSLSQVFSIQKRLSFHTPARSY